MGVGFGIGTGFLVEPLTRRFSLKQCVIYGCLLAAIGTIWTVLAPSELHVWMAVIVVSLAIAMAYSTIVTLFSNQVDEDSQGWVMGIAGAISAFAFGVSGLLLGLLSNMSPQTPMIITACWLVIAAILMKLLFKVNGQSA